MKNRIILNENLEKQKIAIDEIQEIIKSVNLRIESLQSSTISGFCLTHEDILRFINMGADIHKDILYEVNNRLDLSLEKELDRLQITAPLMRTNFKRGAFELLGKFATDLMELSGFPGLKYFNEISVIEGKLVLIKEAEERIRDSFRVVVDTTEGEKLLKLHKETAKNLQSLLSLINSNGSVNLSLGYVVNNLFNYENNQISIQLIKYDMIANK